MRCQFLLSPHPGCLRGFVVCMTWILGSLCQLLLLLTPTFNSLCISFLLLIIASAPRHGGAPQSPEVVIAEQKPKKARINARRIPH